MSGLGVDDAQSPSEFRPELEGLRAVAVGLVLLFHAQIPGWTGGYVGVDVFFVLSGFLITGLIVRELGQAGRIDLPRFYARRARRLLPAAAVALLGTVLLSALFLPPLRLPDVGADAASAALYVSNLRFAFLATDYLASGLPPSPLLHFWSLGVEEQFYLFWPALLLGAALVARRAGIGRGFPSPRMLVGVIAGIGVASFVASMLLTSIAQPWAFFSLPTRAWELAMGALLALFVARTRSIPSRLAGGLVLAGLAAIVAAGILLDESTPFPGIAALLPASGAALVIAGGAAAAATLPGRVLQLGPVRYVGRISYSLYLWHWPILTIPAAVVVGGLDLPSRVSLVAVSILVAAASQRWVEEPIRRGRAGTKATRTLALAGATSVAVSLVAIGIGSAIGASLPGGAGVGASSTGSAPPLVLASSATPHPSVRPTRPPLAAAPVPADLQPPLQLARDRPVIYDDGCHLRIPEVDSPACVFGDATSPTTVVLYGDSHAAQWFPALQEIAIQEHWRLVSLTKSNCSPVDVALWEPSVKRRYDECDTWRQQVIQRIRQEQAALVVASSAHIYEFLDGDARVAIDARPDLWDAGLRRSIVSLASAAGSVAYIGDTPKSGVDVPDCLSAHLDNALMCATPVPSAIDAAQSEREAADLVAAGETFVDPGLWVCPADPCPAVIGSYLVFRDTNHLATPFARSLAQRLLDALPTMAR